jgi:hypothetical protein
MAEIKPYYQSISDLSDMNKKIQLLLVDTTTELQAMLTAEADKNKCSLEISRAVDLHTLDQLLNQKPPDFIACNYDTNACDYGLVIKYLREKGRSIPVFVFASKFSVHDGTSSTS